MSYDDDANIDMYELHHELQRTPVLIAKWRKQYGQAKGEETLLLEKVPMLKADAKAKFDRRAAEIEMHLRENWDSYYSTKAPRLTDKSVSAKLQTLPEYIQAREDYSREVNELAEQISNAVANRETLYGACRAMEERGSSLKELVSLYLSGYYDSKGPKVPKEFIEEDERNQQNRIRKALKLKKGDKSK